MNGAIVNFPFNYQSISVSIAGSTIFLRTLFGLEVSYQVPSNLYVSLPSTFANLVSGNDIQVSICGII